MFDGQGPGWLPNLNLPQGIGVHGAIHGGGTAKEWALKRNAHEAFNRYGLNTIAERFLTSLNVPEGSTGRTYLDNMATVILSEMGMESTDGGSGHSSEDMQQMIIGSMGGHIRAGRYIALPETYVNGTRYRLPYNAFIVTLLDLMGVSPNEYASISNIGQGWGYYNSTLGHPNASRYYQGLSELLV